jgi:hypothetical protein
MVAKSSNFRTAQYSHVEDKMKVFISWSGERSHKVANAIRDWLPMVLQYIKPFVSDEDISAGGRWSQKIADELESSNIGIICITPENISSKWILFESGALSKSVEKGKVIPLLFGLELSDLQGPLSQFQAKKVEEAGIFGVVKSINEVAKNKTDEDIISRTVPALWPQLKAMLTNIPETALQSKSHIDPEDHDLSDEYYKLYGLKDRREDSPLIQDFNISRIGRGGNINAVQYLWADTFVGNTINAEIIKRKPPNLRVRFDNKGGWGCNIAIRSQAECVCRNRKGYRYLCFDARIPLKESKDFLKEVAVAIRVVNGRLQHWEYACHPGQYIVFSVHDPDWQCIKIDLTGDDWHLFASDGNTCLSSSRPDFKAISTVILKFGALPDAPGELSPGKGIIDIRELRLTD